MKKYILLSAFVFITFIAQAQTTKWHVSYVPYLRHINSVAILNPDMVVTAGGHEFNDSLQAVFYSNNQGLAWEMNPLDDISAWIKSIAFADSMHGIGVGYSGKMLRTIDGGHIWAKMSTPAGNTRHFNKIFFLDALTGFVAGGLPDTMQTIMKTTDGGNTWTIVYDQQGLWLRSIHFINATTGFAVGDSGVILTSTNGGLAWTPVAAPVQRDFSSLDFVDNTTGYIVGGSDDDSIRTILQTTNGGLNWTTVKDEPGGWLTDIHFLNATTGYIVGDVATLYKTTNGGQVWTPETVDGALSDSYFTSVRFHSPNFGVIGARSGRVFTYTTSMLPEITTYGANLTSSTSVTFSGVINTHGYPASYKFHYSPNFSMGSAATYANYRTSNSPVLVSAAVSLLNPNTTYRYVASATTLAGTVYGDTLSFFTQAPTFEVRTGQSSQVTTTTATVSGSVRQMPALTSLSFEYDTTPVFAHSQAASPATVNDTFYHIVNAQLTSLVPNKIYYYRIKATVGVNSYYGDVMYFFSGALYTDFRTLAATNMSDTAATMNGAIDKFRLPATFMFDYGTTPSFGSTVPASPTFINDTLPHTLSAVASNLQPLTVYYCRLRAVTQAGDIYGPTVSFQDGTLFTDFRTLPATDVIGSSATLHGTVDKLQAPFTLSFEYGPNFTYNNSIPATPSTVNDTLPHHITGTLSNLLPYTVYSYRLKGQSASGDLFGASYTFTTAGPFDAFETESATEVTESSAQLNGTVQGVSGTMTISFDYGTTLSFGSNIAATSGTITDSLEHKVNAKVTGLTNATVYYFRLRGTTTNGGIFFGDTVQVYIGASVIPNWDFQHWNIRTVQQPVEWTIILDNFEKVPGRTGSALKISNANVAVMGAIGEGIVGGQYYPHRPDSFICYLNYNIEAGDTGYCGVFLNKPGTAVSENFFPITGSSGGQFERIAFPLVYNSPLTPDSLAVAFVTTNIVDQEIVGDHPNSFMVIDDVKLTPSSVPSVLNGGLERWFDNPVEQPVSWQIPAFIYIDSADFSNPYLSRVLFDAPDDYALQVSNMNYKGTPMSMDVSNYNRILSDGKHGTPVSARHRTLNGFYKYEPDGADTMEISIQFYKNSVPVGNAMFREWNVVTEFTPFELTISYFDSTTVPDSVEIGMRAAKREAVGFSRMAVDKLSFDGFASGVAISGPAQSDQARIRLYPNPADDFISIEMESSKDGIVQVFNLGGKLLHTGNIKAGRARVSTTDFAKGIYIVRIVQDGKKLSDKFIVVR